jgi:hypothetical protein
MKIRFLTRILAGERYGGLCVYVCVYVLQHTLSAMDQSVALKIWLALLLNSAILPVLVESRFDSVPDALGGLFFKGAFRDFVPEWYNKVGATLMQSMLIMAATATLMPFVSAFLASVGRFSARRNAVTQLELDEAYIGQKLELSTEVGEMLNLMSVVMLFAAGMPLFYLIGSVYCFFKYWATKYAAMRVYYVLQSDDRLILSAAEILPFNGAVHLAFAIWMLSYVDAGAEADSITSAASQVNLSVRLAHPIFVILTVLLLVYGAYLVVYNFLFRLFEACKNTCSKSSDAEQDEIGNHPSFAEVIRETHAGGQDDEHKVTRLKGFKSYEITVAPDNPCVRNARISCASTTATLCSMLACLRAMQENVRYAFIFQFFQPSGPVPLTGEPTAVAGEASAQRGQQGKRLSFAAFHSASFKKPSTANDVEMRALKSGITPCEEDAEEEEAVDVVVEQHSQSHGAILTEPPTLGRPPSPPRQFEEGGDERGARLSVSCANPGIEAHLEPEGGDSEHEAGPLLGRSNSVVSSYLDGADADDPEC